MVPIERFRKLAIKRGPKGGVATVQVDILNV